MHVMGEAECIFIHSRLQKATEPTPTVLAGMRGHGPVMGPTHQFPSR
jgi:hypothetical protein